MALASDYNDPTSLLVHAPQQEKGEEPVAKIVCGKGSVEPTVRPRLLAKVLKASIEDEGADRWDFTLGNPPLLRGLLGPGISDQCLKMSILGRRRRGRRRDLGDRGFINSH